MLERRLGTLKIGTYEGGWMEEAVRRVKEEGQMKWKVSSSVVLGLGVGMKMVKGMIFGRLNDLSKINLARYLLRHLNPSMMKQHRCILSCIQLFNYAFGTLTTVYNMV
ncbi:hypothetical protein DVH24_012103 [Malus domestica]|uniref:Uncharacterized protein n=1 Tax=Malus domestica TaxID=3750 RepID=A0A498HN94_MALDO|nr:hypothetical protein DVH24_012103 [Malus domestica]